MVSYVILETSFIPVEIALSLTGEVVLFAITLRRHRPRWNVFGSDRPTRFVLLFDLRTGSVW